jgi:hypothetical protein
MAELPQAVVDHLDEIRELCAQNHVLRLSYLDDPHARVPNFVVEFEPHPDGLTRGRRHRALLRGLFHLLGDVNTILPSMIEDEQRRFPTTPLPQYDVYAAQRRSA